MTSTAPSTSSSPLAPPTSSPETFPPIQPGVSLVIAWQIANKPVLIVGGGVVAAGRLSALLDASARVTLIAPSTNLSPEVRHRIADPSLSHTLTYIDRTFNGEEDVQGMEMVLTAIDEIGLSSQICTMCRRLRIPVNVADVPPECDFYFGSIVRKGPLQIMVSTGGKGPRIANRVRRAIEATLPEDVGEAIENVGRLRAGLRKKANGKDTETIARRMDWMIRVCDRWSLAELAEMDDRMREEVLSGWEDGIAKGWWDVNGGTVGRAKSLAGVGRKAPERDSWDVGAKESSEWWTLGSGFLLGVATAGVVALGVARRWK